MIVHPWFMPEGADLRVSAGRVHGKRGIGLGVEYTPEERWLDPIGGSINVLVGRFVFGVWWHAIDPEGVLE